VVGAPFPKTMSDNTHTTESAKVFFTVAEVASRFGISQKSVYRLLERGLLKSSNALRKKMISRASLETFIAASQQGGGR